jgi:hypothetical protein
MLLENCITYCSLSIIYDISNRGSREEAAEDLIIISRQLYSFPLMSFYIALSLFYLLFIFV